MLASAAPTIPNPVCGGETLLPVVWMRPKLTRGWETRVALYHWLCARLGSILPSEPVGWAVVSLVDRTVPGADPPDLGSYAAVLFDLDGVLTSTAALHKRAWAQLFTDYLQRRCPDRPYVEQDYFDYIDGRPRYAGVAALLDSRGIELKWGSADDSPETETVCGLGNRKNDEFSRLLQTEGVTPYPGAVGLLDRLTTCDVDVAVVSSSRNAKAVLAAAGLRTRFSVIVDGAVAAVRELAGKPAPDTFVAAAGDLGCLPRRCVVIEDAPAGVSAGRAGGFGLVIGVDRGAGEETLIASGADRTVTDLKELI
jgi:beta-phosphoglucomutase family hydrolase